MRSILTRIRRSRSRREWILIGTLVFAGVVALRELGVVDLNVQASESTHSFTAEYGTIERTDDRPVGSITVQFHEGTPFELPAKGAAPAEERLAGTVIHVDPYEIEGVYWLPLYKSGSCSYNAEVLRGGEPWGTIEGDLEMSMRGLASARTFRECVHKDIEAKLLATVSNWNAR